MNRIRITGDSTIDLSKELLEKYDIKIMSLYVNLGEDSYRDGITITPEDIYAYVDKEGTLPKSAAPSVGDYADFFEELKKDADAVIHFSIGSSLSSSHNNARLAASEFENVFVIDTENLSTGSALLVLEACEMAESGMEAEKIVEEIKALVPKVDASFIVNQLDYLAKGGRCSGLVALGANVLKLRPTLIVKDGKIEVGKKYRGPYDTCVKQYVEDRLSDIDSIRKHRIFVTNTACDESTVDVAWKTVENTANFDEILHTVAGSTITTHCGPKTLGVLFIRK